MAKRFIDTDLFKKRFVRSLPAGYKLLWVYLFCECDHAGIWEVDLEVAGLFCGVTFTPEELNKRLGDRLQFFDGGSKAFIPDFIEFQYGTDLNPHNPAHRSVIARLEKYGLLGVLKEGIKPTVRPLAAPTKEQAAPKEPEPKKERRTLVRPTLEEVAAYCKERGNKVDPQSWLDYYTANGWKVGRNTMKDWKAAVRTWERNGITTKIHNNGAAGNQNAKGRLGEVPGTTTKEGFTGTL